MTSSQLEVSHYDVMQTSTALPAAIDAAARTISVPKRAPADSFVLHAPLELAARVGILERLAPEDRGPALAQIEATASAYLAAGEPLGPTVARTWTSVDQATATLTSALASQDLATVDAAMSWLAERIDPGAARTALATAIAPALSAAAHVPIGLHLLTRVADGALPASLLRGPLRELARHPDRQLTWFESPTWSAPSSADGSPLEERLRSVPFLGRPGSDFIHPLMDQAERSGTAAAAIGPSLGDDVDAVRRTLLRAAAWSMLHDDPAHAPYGWTHCLTLPQAVLSLAPDALDPAIAIAVAGTHVVGFRAALGRAELGSLDDAAGGLDEVDLAPSMRAASTHPDAHLAKYVLACAHAGEDDPAWRATYHRAAAHLVAWWAAADGS